MDERNGYFQILVKDDGTYIHLIPPIGSGIPVNITDVENYLVFKKIDYDRVPLFSAVNSGTDQILKLNGNKCYQISEMMDIRVAEDKMEVIGRFFAPSEGGDLMSGEEIAKDLGFRKIKAEPDMAEIGRFLKERKYCTDYTVARGIPVQQGSDGKIEFMFNTDRAARPKLNNDGSVDFHELNTVNCCGKGNVLAKLVKEVPGEYGKNVFGEIIKPRDVKKAVLRHGINISVSEDGTEFVSDIDGHVTLQDGMLLVSGVLEINNVDVSTGNIRYEGNLVIGGNITTGYEVKASGDIEIRGIVEGAVVEAGGQITIAKGMNGMNRGVLKAGSNVIAKYISSATVESGGYVQSECIMNSRVNARDRIIVEGKKGFITGGSIRAGNSVEAKTIGSDMGIGTQIEVGVDPQLKARMLKLQKENEELNKNISRVEPVLVAVAQRLQKGEKIPPEQISKMKELSQSISDMKEKVQTNIYEMEQLSLMFDSDTQAQVIVTGDAYQGTRIEISEAVMTLKTDYHYCRFIKEAGDVKMVGM